MLTQQKTKLKKTRKSDIFSASLTAKLLFVVLFILLAVVIITKPHFALADPHAMFYTDRGQEQVFYNVLAALNQADYVEPPPQPSLDPASPIPNPTATYSPTSPPNIDYNARIGNYLASGTYFPRTDQREAKIITDSNGKVTSITVGTDGTASPLEPQERTNLPHITVRQVTSDNGDAFLRESLQRRALAEQMRVELAGISCRILEGIYGPQSIKNVSGITPANGKSPCDEYLKGDNVPMSQ
jgi:hypothetical protein